MTNDAVHAQVAADLTTAHRRVRELDLDEAEKALASRHLLAISDAAKHDLDRAARRLRAFLADLDAGRFPSQKPFESG